MIHSSAGGWDLNPLSCGDVATNSRKPPLSYFQTNIARVRIQLDTKSILSGTGVI